MKRSLESSDLDNILYFRTVRFKDLRLRRGQGLDLRIQVEVKIEQVDDEEDSFWVELSIWNQRGRIQSVQMNLDDLLCFRLDDSVNYLDLPNAKISLKTLWQRLSGRAAGETLASVMTACIAKFGKLEVELDHSFGEEAIDRDKVIFYVEAGGFKGQKTLTWKEVKHVFEQVRRIR